MITLTTDFGDTAYVGAMKGAILRVNPEARIVDITHGVAPQDITCGALALYAAVPHFPDGTVHVGVVDPGVGTRRRGLCIVTRRGLLVGPDNGLLVPAARALGIERVHVLEDARHWASHVSFTFHGRDVFGPVAARLDRGLDPAALGPATTEWVDLDFGPWREHDGALEGLVLSIDPFGDIVTNIPATALGTDAKPGSPVAVRLGDTALSLAFQHTYGEVPPGEGVALVGSSGFLEIAINRGNAARTYGARTGDPVRVRLR